MNAVSMGAVTARCGRWLVSPTKGLGVTWIAIFAVLLFGVRDGRLLVGFLGLSFLAGWASMLLIAAVIPPPAKLSEISALAARVMSFIKVVWSTFVFAAGAVYGGMAGVALGASGALFTSDGGWGYMQKLIWPVVGVVAVIVAWYTVMACAFDLWRAGENRRVGALARVMGELPPELRELPAAEWLGEVVLAFTRGWLPWLLGYLAPPMVMILLAQFPLAWFLAS